jgi:hypothetical protein
MTVVYFCVIGLAVFGEEGDKQGLERTIMIGG